MLIIPAMWEIEIRRVKDQGEPRERFLRPHLDE
jgi:hypothetical protein